MATLKKRRAKWYARVRWYDKYGKRVEKQIPLHTTRETVAIERLIQIEKKEKYIKHGMTFDFPWQNNKGEIRLFRLTLKIAVDEYLKYLEVNGKKRTTIERARVCFNSIQKVLTDNFVISNIKANDIEKIKCYFKDNRSKIGINMLLTRLRGLLNWLVDIKEEVESVPKVKLISHPKTKPSYLTEKEMIKIMSLDGLSDHFKKAFQFYWETGLRLREPFGGIVRNNILEINPNENKTGVYLIKVLKQHQLDILIAMKDRVAKSRGSYRSSTGNYSIVLKKAVRMIGRGDLHFHNLRDTFAVMKYLETRDIYLVSKELGHSSVKVTEKYANFTNFEILKQDFPSITSGNNANRIVTLGDTKMGDTKVKSRRVTEIAMA